jgi:hypothetical protein
MNKKKFNKRLVLNKQAIADLNNGEMSDIRGGARASHRVCSEPAEICPTWTCTP